MSRNGARLPVKLMHIAAGTAVYMKKKLAAY
jgi:hypothetical protein